MIEQKRIGNKLSRTAKSSILLFVILTLILSGAAIHAAVQYKNLARDAVSDIVDGRYDAAIEHFKDYLNKHPNDLESMYGMAVAYTQKQEIDKAVKYIQNAVDEGLPFARFLAGPRDLLKPLTSSPEFKILAEKYAVELLHGPMLGCVTESSAKFWVRTANEVTVEVVVKSAGTGDSFQRRATGKTSGKRDFTAVLAVEGLKSGTLYEYELRIDGDQNSRSASEAAPDSRRNTKECGIQSPDTICLHFFCSVTMSISTIRREPPCSNIVTIGVNRVLNSGILSHPLPSSPSGTTTTLRLMTPGAVRKFTRPNGRFRSGARSSTTGTIHTMAAEKSSPAAGSIFPLAMSTFSCWTAGITATSREARIPRCSAPPRKNGCSKN
jgi:hypothetical protein